MPYSYVILGTGRQGCAIAYDLAKNCEAERLIMVDTNTHAAAEAIDRLEKLLPDSPCRFELVTCDVTNLNEIGPVIQGSDVVVSAVPYKFNMHLTEAAIRAGASFCDLGGNTQIVRAQLHRNEEAKIAGVSVVPDCGLAPGLGNHLAAHGIAMLDEPEDVHIRCGGLPQEKIGPLGYKLVFSLEGLINEYTGMGEFLRDGKQVEIPALTELEDIEFPEPVGKCEAAVTSGGTSTCPETYLGKLKSYDYKTVRYPGHFEVVQAIFGLGCFEDSVRLRNGTTIDARTMLRQMLEEKIDYPDVRDLVVLRVTVSGKHKDKPKTIQYDLYDKHDEETEFTAMERATGFPAALVAYMQARKIIEPGSVPLELSVPAKQFLDELPGHDIRVEMSES
jgi:lysine 6-dehydrogenase